MKQYNLKPTESPVDFKIDYAKELNDEQYRAVTESIGPSLVLAGAGSGKTRTLTYRVAYLLETGVPAERILLVTFTNKAAKEMMNRIEVLHKGTPKGLWGGTFHSIGNRILRMYGKEIGIEPNFNILDSDDSKTLVKSCLSSVTLPKDKFFPKADLIAKIISLSANLSRPIDEVISEKYSHIDESYIPTIREISEIYKVKKKQANALDYDDLLGEWNRLLMECDYIRTRLANKFQYILVDEYQDTNFIQGQIINNLAGRDQNILVVGDDSQSIYSFRGADVNNILTFPTDYPKAKTFRLETNYRSTPEILDLANTSIKYNKNKFDKNLRTEKAGGKKPVLASCDDGYRQAEFIGQRILELQDEGISLSDMVVLFRAHFQSLELEMELNKRNIPYVMRGGLRFFEQQHIKDVVAYLKIINNINDELSWQRILLLQVGVGPANANRIWQAISGLPSLKEAINYPFENVASAKVLSGWQESKKILACLAEIEKDDVSSLIEAILSGGYKNYVKNNFENYSDRIDDLEQLVVFASNYDSLEKLLADVALSEGFKGQSMVDYKEGEDEAITLSTIHQAKGLEWKVVFVIGLANGQFPNAKVMEKQSEMEEERRLFYVACTRAQDQLYLTYPMFSHKSGNINQISDFIKELPPQVYEQWSVNDSFSSNDDWDNDDGENVIDIDSEDSVTNQFWARMRAKR